MSVVYVPKKVYLATAAADAVSELNAFDRCLIKMGLGNVSLIKITSILPKNVEFVNKPPKLPDGANVPSIYIAVKSSNPGDFLVASIALGWPEEEGPLLVAEYGGVNIERDVAEKKVLELLNTMANDRGLKLNRKVVKSITHVVKRSGCAIALVAEVE